VTDVCVVVEHARQGHNPSVNTNTTADLAIGPETGRAKCTLLAN